MSLLIGLDIGTTSVKAGIFAASGRPLAAVGFQVMGEQGDRPPTDPPGAVLSPRVSKRPGETRALRLRSFHRGR